MSDSYADLTFAATYFEGRYPSDAWDNVANEVRTKVLIHGTRLIDQLNFAGDKYDEDQENEFPRGDNPDVPDAIKKANCELAYALLEGLDPELESESAFQTASVFDVIRINRQQSLIPTRILHGIISQAAWNYLRPYLRDPSSITLSRSS